MNNEMINKIRIACQIGLIDRIRPEMRVISVNWDETNIFKMRVYLDAKPEYPDYDDDLDDALAEINSHFMFQKVTLECLFSNEPKSLLKNIGPIIYARKEKTDE